MLEARTQPPARRHPFADHAPVAVGLSPPAARWVFRGSPDAAPACSGAFGCRLPDSVNRAAEDGGRAAICLGPDEWLLVAGEADGPALADAMARALAAVPHSLVDVSHRQVGLDIVGASAALLLNTGCPLDLDLRAFPVGTATRTILSKAEIVLWRQERDRFRVEVWRSFAPYLHAFLKTAEAGL